jgi:NADPH-dependent 2,4-dienoyl-CoA reductase/sulfur reductase-like enzyme
LIIHFPLPRFFISFLLVVVSPFYLFCPLPGKKTNKMTKELHHTVSAPDSTGIKVIIVGLGLAGLTAAIECHRKGHSVIVLEKVSELQHDGMLFRALIPQYPRQVICILPELIRWRE